MVKKRSSFAQHGPYLAIVAVVAVVAIVFLILNFVGVSPVGEAVRFARTASTTASAPASSQEECNSLERRCDLVKKEDIENLVTKDEVEKLNFLDINELTAFYEGKGPGSWRDNSGNKVCSDLGYKSCWASQFEVITMVYSSSDGSCGGTGTAQLHDVSYRTSPCDWVGTVAVCDSKLYLSYLEPGFGDVARSYGLDSVICIE